MPVPNRIHRQRTWQPDGRGKPLVPPGMENRHPDAPIPKTTTMTSKNPFTRIARNKVGLSITVFGFGVGFLYETWLTFFKVPGGETFYDFQRRKAGRDKYEHENNS